MFDDDKKFCMKCEQRLVFPKPGLGGLLSKKPAPLFEFKDGFYCEKCAKAKVEAERSKK